MEKITPGATPNEVRDPSFAKIDDARAAKVLEKLIECSQGSAEVESVQLNDAEASDVVAMLSSRSYLFKIADSLGEPFVSILHFP